MEEKDIIIEFLNKSGFKEKGKNQYFKEGIGLIFVREYKIEIVFKQILGLGRKHQAHDIRNALRINDCVETFSFNPQV